MASEPLVLGVDDEAGILRLMKLELTAQGFRVITASNGTRIQSTDNGTVGQPNTIGGRAINGVKGR